MIGLLESKTAGCDFDIADFDEKDFEVHGWGWRAILAVKDHCVGILSVKGV